LSFEIALACAADTVEVTVEVWVTVAIPVPEPETVEVSVLVTVDVLADVGGYASAYAVTPIRMMMMITSAPTSAVIPFLFVPFIGLKTCLSLFRRLLRG
jgi:hypothetical protein